MEAWAVKAVPKMLQAGAVASIKKTAVRGRDTEKSIMQIETCHLDSQKTRKALEMTAFQGLSFCYLCRLPLMKAPGNGGG